MSNEHLEKRWVKNLERVISIMITIILGFVAWQSMQWTDNFKDLSQSVGELNTKMAVVVTELSHTNEKFAEQKAAIDDHENRLRRLEKKR